MCDTSRVNVEYLNLSKRFSTQSDYTKQYCRIYNVRLSRMREILGRVIEKKWGSQYPICRLHKLSEENYDRCIVIGTLFKDQKLKPSVLKQIAESNQLVPQPILSHCAEEADVLYLEDELQRYELQGILEGKYLVTGISCALLGFNKGNGKFEVVDCAFADFSSQIERPLIENDVYVVFVSGLNLQHIEKSLLSLKIFANWVSGCLGDFNDVRTSQICRLIIAGNSIQTCGEKIKPTFSMTSTATQSTDTINAVKVLDTFLLELCQVIDVDVMPGENDPSNHILPQKSMHHCMLPNSSVYKSLNRVTNPYECEMGGVRFLGTAGQPIQDILRFSEITEPIDVLENCLRWGHLAPTAPDTLGCFPFYESDPFIIENCPHVMFCSNQSKFDTKIAKGVDGQVVRLVCVPEFADSYTACILNLKNLECLPVSFNGL